MGICAFYKVAKTENKAFWSGDVLGVLFGVADSELPSKYPRGSVKWTSEYSGVWISKQG